MWDMDDTFYDREDIVAKTQYIQDLTSQNHYVGWKGHPPNYINRVKTALAALPREHQAAALALFANVIYLPRPWLNEAWREIALELETREGWTPSSGFKEALFLAVDDAGLVTAFSHIAGISRRENHDVNPGYGTVSELIAPLVAFVGAKGQDLSVMGGIQVAREKKWWVLLTDNAISGGSAKSDIEKLQTLKQRLRPKSMVSSRNQGPDILLCAQVITEQALEEIASVLPRSKVFYGIKFDNRFRVNSDDCVLFSEPATLIKVRKLCEWFGNIYFLQHAEKRFEERLKAHKKKGGQTNYAYGWRDCGYTIVTEENCPSNSVPLLYYTPSSTDHILGMRYMPPFPRTESRETHKTSHDKVNLERLGMEESLRIIRQGLDRLEGASERINI